LEGNVSIIASHLLTILCDESCQYARSCWLKKLPSGAAELLNDVSIGLSAITNRIVLTDGAAGKIDTLEGDLRPSRRHSPILFLSTGRLKTSRSTRTHGETVHG
jgi:hypothetical protein